VTPRLYRATEVCEAAGLQPYVLRSWEKEFPGIGVQKSQDSPRLYRQSDLDQVLHIKQLVFGEGLTLAGARRRIEETSPTRPAEDAREILETLGADARTRIARVRVGLQSLLDVLSKRPDGGEVGRTRMQTLKSPPQKSARPNLLKRRVPSSKPAVKAGSRVATAPKAAQRGKRK
jgi:DNA-binding transcriptional MerR regulator